MDLSTTYLGFQLPHPLMVGASPMSTDLDTVRKLEDAGASALVMHSLFEEQITREENGTLMDMELHEESFAEATSYFPKPADFRLGIDPYLEQIHKIKDRVQIPVIASLNGTTPAGWLNYAKQMAQAGADALELNIYYVATDPRETGENVERRTLASLKLAKSAVGLPVSIKISPYFSSLAHLASLLDGAQAEGLVLFNRFLQPDFDLEKLEVEPTVKYSSPGELRLRLRWLAILRNIFKGSLAASGGVHSGQDALKAIMAGADAVQLVSSLLIHGPGRLSQIHQEMQNWLEQHEYDSLAQAKGSLSLEKCPNPKAFERAHYLRVLTGWKS